jgi:amino acid transporter
MKNKLKSVLIGRPLRNEAIGGQKYSVFLGLPILASDAISSVAYASEQILIVLIPAIGVLAYAQLSYISAAIIALLLILTFSYRQTIHSYPNGGGSYIVASDNLGKIPGITAGASLAVDYILTVAVSISSGTAAITSAFPVLYPFRVIICVLILLFIMLGNLRGIKESSRMFSIPTYAFIFVMLTMIVVGITNYLTGNVNSAPPVNLPAQTQSITVFLILSAFANGCTALTGVEAVSNAIPNFQKPQIKNAQKVLLLLSLFVLLLFGGISILANIYHVGIIRDRTVLSQIAAAIFTGNFRFMFYIVQATTAIILAMAANTSFSDFPLLVSLMAKDGFAPRQLSMRGDRLSFSNGILLLSAIAAVLIIVFSGDTDLLIPLYAVGVFISFTLSQFGMFKRWLTRHEKGWHYKAVINGVGALVTFVVASIIAATKFTRGAWIVVIVIPLMIIMMLKVKRHYQAVAKQLKLEPEQLAEEDIEHDTYRNRVILPIESINRASIRALRYAKTISENVIAFNVSLDEESGEKVKQRFGLMNTDIPLYVRYSPYRKVAEPLLDFIQSEEYDLKKGDMITVIMPQFVVNKWWQRLLHNGSGSSIERQLLKHKHIVIATMPLQLIDDDTCLKKHDSKAIETSENVSAEKEVSQQH